MLTSVARTALRRVLARAPAASTFTVVRTLPVRSALRIRSFTSSQPAREPAASAGAKKSTVAKKAPRKKAATTTKKKKKVAAKKPKAKKKALKPKPKRTSEEKDAEKIKQLKKLSLLKEPKPQPVSPWLLYIQQNVKDQPSVETSKATGVAYRNLSATDMAELRATTEANKTANAAQRLQWVESFSPEIILLANLSRRELARKTGKKIALIEDARLPRHSRNAFNFYVSENLSGRGRDPDNFKNVTTAWKTLSPEERRPFEDMAEAEKTLMSRLRSDLKSKVKELRKTIKAEAKQTKAASQADTTKAAATNELGL